MTVSSSFEALGKPTVSLLRALSNAGIPLGLSEAARQAGKIGPSTASRILNQLTDQRIVLKQTHGAYPQYSIARPDVVEHILKNFDYHAATRKRKAPVQPWTGIFAPLAKLWHPSLNGELTPSNVHRSDPTEYYWLCERNHTWKDSPRALSSNIRRMGEKFVPCKICRGVQFLSGYNDLFTLYPLLAAEFDVAKNGIETHLVPVYGEHITYWWKCPEGHPYDATIANRVYFDSGCRYCAGQDVLAGFNDLKSKAPQLLSTYDYETNPDPSTVYYRSTVTLNWICEQGHRFPSTPARRLEDDVQCSVCANKTLSKEHNSLAVRRPDLALEWDYEGNYPLTPDDVIAGGKKEYSWTCPKHGAWRANMENRVYQNTGCNECTYGTVSKIQIALQEELKLHLATNAEWRLLAKESYRIPAKYGTYNRIDVDMVLENKAGEKLVIEYDGHRFHKTKEAVAKDLQKTKILIELGFFLLRIREGILENVIYNHANLTQINYIYSLRREKVAALAEAVTNSLPS